MHLPWLLIGLLGIWYSLFGVRNGFLHVWLNRKTTVTHMWVLRKKQEKRKTTTFGNTINTVYPVPVRQSQWNGMPSALLRKKKTKVRIEVSGSAIGRSCLWCLVRKFLTVLSNEIYPPIYTYIFFWLTIANYHHYEPHDSCGKSTE